MTDDARHSVAGVLARILLERDRALGSVTVVPVTEREGVRDELAVTARRQGDILAAPHQPHPILESEAA